MSFCRQNYCCPRDASAPLCCAQHDVLVLNNQQPTTNNQQPTTNNQQPTTRSYLCPVMVARPRLGGAAEKGIPFDSGAVPATVRLGKGEPKATVSMKAFSTGRPEKWEGGSPHEASQETCQGIHRFSSRGGRLENDSSGYPPGRPGSVFGLGSGLDVSAS
jgi:hypothetical protein